MTWDWGKICAPYAQALERRDEKAPDDVLLVSLGEQKLVHWQRVGADSEWTTVATHACSSGRNPPSCVEDSEGTPLGLHAVVEKYGEGEPVGTVFVGRVSTGQRYWEREDFGPAQRMLVTTRILRLQGLEPGLNAGPGVDSYRRYIYLHGTTRPEQFPRNLSAGCLTLLDEPLIALYDSVPIGAHVWIGEEWR